MVARRLLFLLAPVVWIACSDGRRARVGSSAPEVNPDRPKDGPRYDLVLSSAGAPGRITAFAPVTSSSWLVAVAPGQIVRVEGTRSIVEAVLPSDVTGFAVVGSQAGY